MNKDNEIRLVPNNLSLVTLGQNLYSENCASCHGAHLEGQTNWQNRDDEGYVTFGIVRNGMSHVRAIAMVPTSDDPTGTDLDNPFSSAGRPVYEVHISKVKMIGVIPGSEKVVVEDEDDSEEIEEQSFFATSTGKTISLVSAIVILLGLASYLILVRAKEEQPESILVTTDDNS